MQLHLNEPRKWQKYSRSVLTCTDRTDHRSGVRGSTSGIGNLISKLPWMEFVLNKILNTKVTSYFKGEVSRHKLVYIPAGTVRLLTMLPCVQEAEVTRWAACGDLRGLHPLPFLRPPPRLADSLPALLLCQGSAGQACASSPVLDVWRSARRAGATSLLLTWLNCSTFCLALPVAGPGGSRCHVNQLSCTCRKSLVR